MSVIATTRSAAVPLLAIIVAGCVIAAVGNGTRTSFGLFTLPITGDLDNFAAAMGLLWLSAVPLTAGLVALFFGARYLGMLYGVALLSHQIGSFMGVWLGGVAFDQTGSYNLVWYLGILLGLGSAAIHLPIRERTAPSFQLQAAG